MQFDNIEEVKNHEFKGNGFSDQGVFDAIRAFVSNPQICLADKAEALRIMSDKGMGLGRECYKADWEVVLEYMRAL